MKTTTTKTDVRDALMRLWRAAQDEHYAVEHFPGRSCQLYYRRGDWSRRDLTGLMRPGDLVVWIAGYAAGYGHAKAREFVARKSLETGESAEETATSWGLGAEYLR